MLVRSRRSFTATSIGFADLADSRARASHFYRAITLNSKAASPAGTSGFAFIPLRAVFPDGIRWAVETGR
jgi:hypothetical protein